MNFYFLCDSVSYIFIKLRIAFLCMQTVEYMTYRVKSRGVCNLLTTRIENVSNMSNMLYVGCCMVCRLPQNLFIIRC